MYSYSNSLAAAAWLGGGDGTMSAQGLATALMALALATVAAQQPQVRTTTGMVAGLEQDGIFGFLGIPFAAPPVGTQRLRPPQPHAPWSGVRQATAPGAHCLQGSLHPKSSPCGGWCEAHGHEPDGCGCGVCGSFGSNSFAILPPSR